MRHVKWLLVYGYVFVSASAIKVFDALTPVFALRINITLKSTYNWLVNFDLISLNSLLLHDDSHLRVLGKDLFMKELSSNPKSLHLF